MQFDSASEASLGGCGGGLMQFDSASEASGPKEVSNGAMQFDSASEAHDLPDKPAQMHFETASEATARTSSKRRRFSPADVRHLRGAALVVASHGEAPRRSSASSVASHGGAPSVASHGRVPRRFPASSVASPGGAPLGSQAVSVVAHGGASQV